MLATKEELESTAKMLDEFIRNPNITSKERKRGQEYLSRIYLDLALRFGQVPWGK